MFLLHFANHIEKIRWNGRRYPAVFGEYRNKKDFPWHDFLMTTDRAAFVEISSSIAMRCMRRYCLRLNGGNV